VSQRSYAIALTLGAVAIVASVAGAFAGERLKIPEEDWISHSLVVLGLVGLLLGPFLVIGSFLTRGIAIIFGAILLAGIIFVSRWFKREDIIEEEEMSIRPEAARKAKGQSP
jgi:protein-S-isoprenylcysteine O-methyltransferase Ste14